jgi:hypothetical protein
MPADMSWIYPKEYERYRNARGWNPGVFVRGTKVLGEYSSRELAETRLLARLREWAKTQRKHDATQHLVESSSSRCTATEQSGWYVRYVSFSRHPIT